MKFKIKNPSLVVKEEADTLTIQNVNPITGKPTKLSEVLEFLPFGIIYKEETGMGATTLELECRRNSIIVEPLRSIAYSKSQNPKNPIKAFYVGTKPGDTKGAKRDEINSYLEEVGTFKKFLVVADSLPTLLKEIPVIQLKSFHLLLDESDSYQLNSTFRESMEICLLHYKSFPKERRAMVTATPLNFTDPELEHEQIHTLKYKDKILRPVVLTETPDCLSTLKEVILEHFKNSPSQKLVVALNRVGLILDIINSLKTEPDMDGIYYHVLCSEKRKDTVGKYFAELKEGSLPGQLTFVTSAYYAGIDLNESYHLITVSSPSQNTLQLSEHTIRQIAGRCRAGLLSETILYQPKKSPASKFYSFNELLIAAQKELVALKCIESNFLSNDLLRKKLLKVRERLVNTSLVGNYRLLFSPDNIRTEISYLNLDAYLEGARVAKEVYKDSTSFKEALEKSGCEVTVKVSTPKTKVKKTTKRDLQFEDELDSIKSDLTGLKSGIVRISDLIDIDLSELEKMPATSFLALSIYQNYVPFMDSMFLADNISHNLHNTRSHTTNSLRLLDAKLFFATLDPEEPYKKDLLKNIIPHKTYSDEELESILTTAVSKSSLHVKYDHLKLKTGMTSLGKIFQMKAVKLPTGKSGYRIQGLHFSKKISKHRSLGGFSAADYTL